MAGEWRDCLLGDVIELKRGYDLPERERRAGAVPIISSSGPSGFHDQVRVTGPGVVTGRYGTIGQVFYVPGDFWPLNTTLYVRDFKGNDPRFVSYFLRGLDYLAYSDKAAVPGVNRNHLHQAEVQLPEDVDDQRAIAHILGTLDDKIDLNRRMSETLEAMARALFKSWFVDFDPVRAKAEGRDPGVPDAIANLFPDALTEHPDLGEIPEGWKAATLSDCVHVARGLSYKGSGLSDDGVPMHNLNSIYEGGGYKFEGLKRYSSLYKPQHVARAGDLIVANTEQGHHRLLIGYAAIVPECFAGDSLFSHHVYRVRVKRESSLTSDYLCHLLNTPAMHDTVSGYANGTTVNMLPMDGLNSPLIVAPPPSAVAAFTAIAGGARLRREWMVEESRTLAALHDALLPKLISGELRLDDPERVLGRTCA
jgi:type I restriction enzyme S subunit